MAIEIERRFLVKSEEWRQYVNAEHFLRQGYLTPANNEAKWSTRIRILEERKAWLTLKTPINEISNHEFEYLIPLDDAELIWTLATYKLTKIRYELNLTGGRWVIDCFKGENSPLMIAEVELSKKNAPINRPDWCTKEITGLTNLNNASLANRSIAEWPLESRISQDTSANTP